MGGGGGKDVCGEARDEREGLKKRSVWFSWTHVKYLFIMDTGSMGNWPRQVVFQV